MRRRVTTARIALIGLSGAGKTTVAPLLAERLGLTWRDLDTEIERRAGVAVERILRERGEAAFREIEAETLRDTLGLESDAGLVLACGAGVAIREENRQLLRHAAFAVWLSVDPGVAAGRLSGAEAGRRPLLVDGSTEERLRELLAERLPHYEAAADATIETDRLTPAEVAAAIVALGKGRRGWGPSES
jgi:shikimate kinase